MTVGLRITDGTTTVTVSNGTTGILTGYTAGAAPENIETVVDRAKFLALGGLATVRATVRDLNRLFGQARRKKETKMGPQVYVERDLGDGVWWRAIIEEAVPLPEPEAFDLGAAQGKMELELAYTRENSWEGAEAQVPLTNPNGTNNTSGLNVFNCNDGAGSSPNIRRNYVEIAAANVDGDLPAPTRLEMLNTFATGQLADVWIGQNWTDTTLNHILEGEAASGGTNVGDGTASGGNHKSYSLPSGTETEMLTWSLGSTLLNAARGNRFKMFCRFAITGPSQYVRYRLRIKWNAVTIWESGQVQPSTAVAHQIRDLFTLRLPPWLPSLTGLDAVSLILTGQQETGSNINVLIDFLQITALDGFRHLRIIGYGTPQNSRIIDDGINGEVYRDDGAGGGKIGIYVPYGKALMLKPGTLQRLYFLMHNWTSNTAEVGRSISVKLFYRPRRLTL